MRTVFITDSHGYKQKLLWLLAGIGLVDEDGNWIAGSDVRLVHLGDYVDRGPESVELFRWLADLQSQYPRQIVRLVGNHELQYVGGPWAGGEAEVREVAREIYDQIEDGRLRFAYAFEDDQTPWLCVHGGLAHAWEELHNKDIHEVVNILNGLGQDYVIGQVVDVPEIAAVDGYRGGNDDTPGITWCDVEDNLRPHEKSLHHRQIVGHRMQDKINLSAGGKIWACNVPYGHMQALIYTPGEGFSVSEMFY